MGLRQQSFSMVCLRYILVVLCLTLIIIQVTEALNDHDDAAEVYQEENTEHDLSRRNSKKVAQMLQQMLQRGEMQVEPYRIHKFLGRLHRRKSIDESNDLAMPVF